MEFDKKLLKQLNDSGKEICIYSNLIAKSLKDFHPDHFNNFSKTSY